MNDNPHSGSHPDPAEHSGAEGAILAGRYRILRKLGEGAMGAVYLGEHLRIGRKDAIKVLRGGLATDAESIARFNRGARNLSAIRHPNVCTLYDYGETEDGSPFLALEFITGETLKDLLEREGRLPNERALAIACQIADALQAAHDAGIVHRDLKPANVMLERARDGSDVVKVVDFDIAKGPEVASGQELTRLGYVVGTPEYMSPEQLMGEKLDGRSDIYSLGIVLFRMLTGAYPFDGSTDQEIMVQRLTAEPKTLDQAVADARFPPSLQATLDRALARDREQRYTRADEVTTDLRAALTSDAPTRAHATVRPPAIPETRVASSAGPPPRVSGAPSGPRSPIVWIAAIALLATASVVTVVMLRNGGSPDPIVNQIPIDSGNGGGGSTPGGGGGNPPDTGSVGPGGGGQNRGGGVDPPVRTFDPARAGAVLLDLLELMEDETAANARVARDSATLIYDTDGVSVADRARAAYVLGAAERVLGNPAECERWMQKALDLRPDGPGFQEGLASCRAVTP